ncbi:MAG: hypothetical protein JWN70_4022 [Planctomycetaceae bacterium]|nr:hypothetical protein [Planctomycetaceae bacterium]
MRVVFPEAELTAGIDAAALALRQRRRDVLERVGQELLELARQAYIDKSRGGTGSDGIKWAPLKVDTVRSRLPRKQLKSKKVVKGSQPRHQAGTIVSKGKAKSNTGNVMPGSSEIGVNTGFQRNSARPGYQGPDGKGGNIAKMLDEDSLLIGFGRIYSEYFDKYRPLFPEVIPPEWLEKLEEQVANDGGQILADELHKGGLS